MDISIPPLDGDRDEAIAWLAEHNVIPVKNPWCGYTLRRMGEKIGGSRHLFGPKTTQAAIENIGIETDQECQQVREQIKEHQNWES